MRPGTVSVMLTVSSATAGVLTGAANRARPKSSTFTAPSGDHNVGRFQVAMDDPGLMGNHQRRQDLSSNRRRFHRRKRTAGQQFGQRLSLHELSGNKRPAFPFADLKYRHDVWMVQRRRQPR